VGPIDRRIRHTLNSYANARKEPRRQYIHTRTPEASVYTLRPVFCIPSSELIQSRGPPGDFRCGEIVIVTRYFVELSRWERRWSLAMPRQKASCTLCTGPDLQTCSLEGYRRSIDGVVNCDHSRRMYERISRENLSSSRRKGKPRVYNNILCTMSVSCRSRVGDREFLSRYCSDDARICCANLFSEGN